MLASQVWFLQIKHVSMSLPQSHSAFDRTPSQPAAFETLHIETHHRQTLLNGYCWAKARGVLYITVKNLRLLSHVKGHCQKRLKVSRDEWLKSTSQKSKNDTLLSSTASPSSPVNRGLLHHNGVPIMGDRREAWKPIWRRTLEWTLPRSRLSQMWYSVNVKTACGHAPQPKQHD